MDDTFSKRLKKLRNERGKTQEEMAEALDVKRSTYGEYERGKIFPSVDKIEVLAKILITTPQYLLGWDEQRQVSSDSTVTGSIIRRLREQRKLTSKEFANEINISVSDLEKYEDGTHMIPMSVINLIVDYYNISITDLVEFHVRQSKTVFSPMQKERLRKFSIWTREFGNIILTQEEVEKIINYAKYLLHQRKDNEK